MAVAILLGLLAGAAGFAPLFIGLRLTRRVTATSNFGYMSILILSLIASFAILFASAVICATVARDVALHFVLSEAVAVSVVAIAYGISKTVRKR